MKKFLLLMVAVALVGCTTLNDVSRHLRHSDSANERLDQGISAEAKQTIDHANAAATKLQSDLQLAQQKANQVPDLQEQLAAYKNIGTPQEIKTKLDQLAKLKSELQLAQKEIKDRRALLEKAEAGLQSAQNEINKQRTRLVAAAALANRVPELQQQLEAYKIFGTPQGINTKLDQLVKLKASQPGVPALPGVRIDPTTGLPLPGSPPQGLPGGTGTLPNGPKPPPKQFVIQNHDPQLGFYVINAGSDNGINKGDKLTVFRDGKAIGRIEISRTQPTVSIAVYQKGFPKPSVPFKSGDKVGRVPR